MPISRLDEQIKAARLKNQLGSGEPDSTPSANNRNKPKAAAVAGNKADSGKKQPGSNKGSASSDKGHQSAPADNGRQSADSGHQSADSGRQSADSGRQSADKKDRPSSSAANRKKAADIIRQKQQKQRELDEGFFL